MHAYYLINIVSKSKFTQWLVQWRLSSSLNALGIKRSHSFLRLVLALNCSTKYDRSILSPVFPIPTRPAIAMIFHSIVNVSIFVVIALNTNCMHCAKYIVLRLVNGENDALLLQLSHF